MIGGRYGLSSKEFTPAMAAAALDELTLSEPKPRFTVGIDDDVTHLSLDIDADFCTEPDDVVRAVFYGLGSDGTVGANQNSIRIIGEEAGLHAQGYFVYDSKKSGSITVSHLRFGPRPIRSSYLVDRAGFVACHQFGLLEKLDVLDVADEGATFLLNSPYGPEAVWDELPREVQEQIVAKRLRFFVVDATAVAQEAGLGKRVNTVLQTCFFALADVLPLERAITAIKQAIRRSYGKRGDAVVRRNLAAVDSALQGLAEVDVPAAATSARQLPAPVPDTVPAFVANVTAAMLAGRGDPLPVSALPPSTGPSRSGRRATRSARSRSRSRSGIPPSASIAPSARSSARTRRSG